MREFGKTDKSVTFGFGSDRCQLQFDQKPVTSIAPGPNDFYWKIGITLRDLDAAVSFLRDQGLAVSDPVQFRDIGYMSKIFDPKGFTIELLQQGFKGHEKQLAHGHPVGSQAILAHITLRVTDLAAAKYFFEDGLGMRLMSVQPVREHGFCLYFYSWSDVTLPDPDLEAIENREWLWSRPYTFIELQHLENTSTPPLKTSADMSGFDGFSIAGEEPGKLTFISRQELQKLV